MHIRLRQIKHDCDILSRKLGYLSEENIHYKMRLTEILNDFTLDKNLNDIELNQNLIIELDDFIRATKVQLKELYGLIEINNMEHIDLIHINLNLLKKQMAKVKLQFNTLSINFNNFLLELMVKNKIN